MKLVLALLLVLLPYEVAFFRSVAASSRLLLFPQLAVKASPEGNDPFALTDELVLSSGDTPGDSNEKAVKRMIAAQSSSKEGEGDDTPKGVRKISTSSEVNKAAISRIQRSQSQELLATTASSRGEGSEGSKRYGNDEFSISQLSLTEISQFTQFSMQYLADFAAQLGCPVPIDVHEKTGNLMTGDMLFELLVAVNTLEPFDADSGYNSVTIEELADELGVTTARVMRVLVKERATLAFGKDTSLHTSLVSKIVDVYEDPEFDEPKTQEQADEDERRADDAADPQARDRDKIIDILTGG